MSTKGRKKKKIPLRELIGAVINNPIKATLPRESRQSTSQHEIPDHIKAQMGLGKYYMGIDPGRNGALVVPDSFSKLIKWAVGIEKVVYFLKHTTINYTSIAIEKAQSMPRQGVSSMFNYGESFGMIQGILYARNMHYHAITPQAWQKSQTEFLSEYEDQKKRASAAASKIFSLYFKDNYFKLPKQSTRSPILHDGFVDALLIANFAKQLNNDHVDHKKIGFIEGLNYEEERVS